MSASSKTVGGKCRAPRALRVAAILSLAFPVWMQAADYTVDLVHSRIGFSIRHLGISKVSGQFTNYTARMTLDKSAMESLSAEATIQVASVDTDVARRDEHLRGGDFFDAAKFPEIKFEGAKAEKAGDGWLLVGKFTMRGTSRTVKLPVTVSGPITDPWGNQRIGLHAQMTINRHDYGVGSDKVGDKGVGNEVTLDIDLEAIAKK